MVLKIKTRREINILFEFQKRLIVQQGNSDCYFNGGLERRIMEKRLIGLKPQMKQISSGYFMEGSEECQRS